MKVRSFLLLIIVFPLFALAQDRRGGQGGGRSGGYSDGGRSGGYTEGGSALSVFSENGDQFFLIINGVKQNTYPQTRVRVEGLPQVTNDVQIIFDDNRTPAIQKRITFANPVDNNAINLVLRLERTPRGNPVLSFHKSSQLMRDYRPEQGEYVMYYGRDKMPQPVIIKTPPPPPPPPAPREMDPATFNDAKSSIVASSFENTKLSTAKTILGTNLVSTDQVIEICNLFSFENTKLEFAKFAYNKTVDRNNYFKVGNVFSFSSSKEDLNNFISGGR